MNSELRPHLDLDGTLDCTAALAALDEVVVPKPPKAAEQIRPFCPRAFFHSSWQHVLVLPAKERVHESTMLPQSQIVIVGSAPAPTLETEVHLPPIRGVVQAHGVQDRRWLRHAAVERAPAVSSRRERERAPINDHLDATITACESEMYSITVATKIFKTVDQHGYGRPGYYPGE